MDADEVEEALERLKKSGPVSIFLLTENEWK